MASNPASVTDLVARSLRPLTQIEQDTADQLLEDAWNIIVTRLSSVDDRMSGNPSVPFRSLVIQIQCAMVLRVMNNPDGKLEETSDDYTYRLDQAVSTGALYLSDAEMSLLGSSGGSETAFTIKPAGSAPDQVFMPSQWYPF
jgi:hypothetical protein